MFVIAAVAKSMAARVSIVRPSGHPPCRRGYRNLLIFWEGVLSNGSLCSSILCTLLKPGSRAFTSSLMRSRKAARVGPAMPALRRLRLELHQRDDSGAVAVHQAVLHPGGLVDDSLDLLRVDVLTRGAEDHVLQASPYRKPSPGVHGPQVTGPQPTVLREHFPGAGFILVVAAHDIGSPHLDLPFPSVGARVRDPHLYARAWPSRSLRGVS